MQVEFYSFLLIFLNMFWSNFYFYGLSHKRNNENGKKRVNFIENFNLFLWIFCANFIHVYHIYLYRFPSELVGIGWMKTHKKQNEFSRFVSRNRDFLFERIRSWTYIQKDYIFSARLKLLPICIKYVIYK